MNTMSTYPTIAAFSLLALYALPVTGAPANLVKNGSFELGNSGFTSDYDLSIFDGGYVITTDPSIFNENLVSAGDHTTGTGNMFSGNGHATAGKTVWESQNIHVLANTTYTFEAWTMNVCCKPSDTFPNPVSTNPASLRFDIVVGSEITTLGNMDTNLNAGIWDLFSTNWNSATSTDITLRITDTNTEIFGNDFAIDDIRFSTPVPEPETYAMFLLGLGLLGFMSAYRKGKVS